MTIADQVTAILKKVVKSEFVWNEKQNCIASVQYGADHNDYVDFLGLIFTWKMPVRMPATLRSAPETSLVVNISEIW